MKCVVYDNDGRFLLSQEASDMVVVSEELDGTVSYVCAIHETQASRFARLVQSAMHTQLAEEAWQDKKE